MIAVRLLAIFAYISVAHAFFGNKHTTSRLTLLSASATDTTMPEPRVGDKIPAVTLYEGLGDFEKQEVNLLELIAGKKVVIFGVPGAFTPGCSKSHLPSFIDAQDELKAKGVELTICIATNDLYVMEVCTSIFYFFSYYTCMIIEFTHLGCVTFHGRPGVAHPVVQLLEFDFCPIQMLNYPKHLVLSRKIP